MPSSPTVTFHLSYYDLRHLQLHTTHTGIIGACMGVGMGRLHSLVTFFLLDALDIILSLLF